MPRDWDKRLAKLGGHAFQSSLWAEFQNAQNRQVLMDEGQEGESRWQWTAAIRHGRLGFNYLYAAYGPTVNDGKSLRAALKSLREMGKTHNADFVRFEPMGRASIEPSDLRKLGARPVADMQPPHRMVLDLTRSEVEIRHAMKPSNRNLVNTAAKRGLSFVISDDPADTADFLAMQHATAKRGGWKPQADSYYYQLTKSLLPTGQAKLYFVERDGERIASAFCVDFGGTRYYIYAGTHPEQNSKYKAAIALLWWLIMDAQTKGLKAFDYGGVAPDGAPANHPWTGHTKFKKSIGGETVSSVGTWDIPLKSSKYMLYTLLKKVV
jgi:lipid II:glycine glycyltransferase (peptidoglycan interpeptide bridge formation enzyme)